MKTVLIIEDSAELASHWQFAFERHDLHVIHEPAYDKAIQLIGSTPIDLVITDFSLPNVSGELLDLAGLAILSYIALQVDDPPKVIAVTGSTTVENSNSHFVHLLKCAQLLQKPVDVESIVALGLELLDEKAADQRQERMRAIAETHATDPVIWFREDGSMLQTNSKSSELLGYTSKEFQQTPVAELFTDEVAQELADNFKKLNASGNLKFNLPLRHKDETPVECEVYLRQVAINPEESLVFARLHDIRDKKLQEELRLLGAAVKSTQDAFLIAKVDPEADPEFCVVFANEAYSKMTGYTLEETIGKKPRSMEGADTNQDALIALADALEHRRPLRTEILLYGKDDTAFWCDFRLSPIADSQGHATHWLMVMSDITQMKHSNDALLAVSGSHRAMVELLGTNDGVWDWNMSTDFVNYYPGCRKVLGYGPDDDDEFPNNIEAFNGFLHPDDLDRVMASQRASLQSRTPFEDQYRLRHKDGHYIWIHGRAAAIYGSDGVPMRMVGSIYDISKLKTVEHQLKLERLMLQRSNSDLEQFAYVASHDLQEPLRAVGGFMQVLDRDYADQLDEKAAGYVRKAVQGAARMQQLINDLLHFSRITREVQETKPVDLDNAVQQACVTLDETLKERKAQVNFRDLPTIDGELTQLTQLFQNLIDNGTKYCESESPSVDIAYTDVGDHYHVSVTDNGIGIEPEYRDQIFSIFKRLHHREEYSGTGIGLAICHRVVQRHGGSISVEGADGGGSRFVLKFPKQK